MKQSRLVSFIEQVLNVGSGFFLSLLYWQFVIVPQVEGVDLTFLTNLSIALQFTVISVIRGFIWRRLFNHDKFANWVETKFGDSTS